MPPPNARYQREPTVDELLRYVAHLATMPKPGDLPNPLPPADFNESQLRQAAMTRRLAEWGTRNGPTDEDLFRIVAAKATNDVTIRGVGSGADDAALYHVGGLPCVLPGTIAYRDNGQSGRGALTRFLHPRSTSVGDDELGDSALRMETNRAVGFLLTPNIDDENGPGSTPIAFRVIANTEGVYKVDLTEARTRYGMPSLTVPMVATAGDRYRLELEAPALGIRSDLFYLDAYTDQIGHQAVPGDYEYDPSLVVSDGGQPLVPTTRLKIAQRLLYVPAGEESTAYLQPEAIGENLYRWTDLDGNDHVCTRIARLRRTAGKNTIDPEDVDDLRTPAGRWASVGALAILGALLEGGVLSATALAPTLSDSSTLHVGAGPYVRLGVRSTFEGAYLSSAWEEDTDYYFYLAPSTGAPQFTKTAPPSDAAPIARATGGPGGTLENLVDLRHRADNLLGLFRPNTAGVLERSLTLLAYGAQPAKDGGEGGVGGIVFTNEAKSVLYGMLTCSVADGLSLWSATKKLSLGAGQQILRFDPDTGAIVLEGKQVTGTHMTTLDLMAAGKEILRDQGLDGRRKKLGTGRLFWTQAGDPTTPAPIEGPIIIPAGGAWINEDAFVYESGASSGPDTVAGHWHTLQGTYKPVRRRYDMVRFNLSAGAMQLLSSVSDPLVTLEIPVPRGVVLPQIELLFHDTLPAGAAMTLSARLFSRRTVGEGDPMPTELVNAPHPGGYPYKVACGNGGAGTWRTITFTHGLAGYYYWNDAGANEDRVILVCLYHYSGDSTVWTPSGSNSFAHFVAARLTAYHAGMGQLVTGDDGSLATALPIPRM